MLERTHELHQMKKRAWRIGAKMSKHRLERRRMDTARTVVGYDRQHSAPQAEWVDKMVKRPERD